MTFSFYAVDTNPLWTPFWTFNGLYFSERAYDAAVAAGISGLDLSTQTTVRHVKRSVFPAPVKTLWGKRFLGR
jgi:hypothetical protein